MLEGQQRVLSRYFFEKGLLRFTSSWRSTTDSFKTNPFTIFLSALQVIIESRKNSRKTIVSLCRTCKNNEGIKVLSEWTADLKGTPF